VVGIARRARDCASRRAVRSRVRRREQSAGRRRGRRALPERAVLKLPADVRVHLALEPCDMRKQFDGLAALVLSSLGERTARIWSRHGFDLPTSTLYDWNARSADEASFLAPIARRETLSSALVSFDDTPILAKAPERETGTQRGRLWLYIGDIARVAYCEYTPDWKGKHPQKVLAGFSGALQSDGYGGIAGLFRGPDAPNKVGCNDHAGR